MEKLGIGVIGVCGRGGIADQWRDNARFTGGGRSGRASPADAVACGRDFAVYSASGPRQARFPGPGKQGGFRTARGEGGETGHFREVRGGLRGFRSAVRRSQVKGGPMDLETIAQRLDANEKLKVKYRLPVKDASGETTWQVRVDKLLDVDVERSMLYVAFEGNSVIWVKKEEAIEVSPDDGVYE